MAVDLEIDGTQPSSPTRRKQRRERGCGGRSSPWGGGEATTVAQGGGGGCGRPGDGADAVGDGLVRRGGELVTYGMARLIDVHLTKPGQGKEHGGEVGPIEGSKERERAEGEPWLRPP